MSRGHKIVANFLKNRGAWDNKPTTVSSYVGKDAAAKPADKKPKLDAKVLNQYIGKRVAEAAVKMRTPAYNPVDQEHIMSSDSEPGVDSAVNLTARATAGNPEPTLKKNKKVAEATQPPFDKPYKKTTGTITDKSGAKHGPMSKARDLARKGLKQMMKINPKIAEGWNENTLDQLDEVHPAVMAMARVGANKALKAKADQHTELALAANKAGDDAKVKFHQAQVAKLKAQMQKEAVTYTGMGTDVVDKKKKLNPQPNLTMKPKQVKDFKEETIAEGKVYGHEVDVKKYDSHLHGQEGEYYDGLSDHAKDKEHLHHLMKKHGYKEDEHYTAYDNAMHDDMLHDVNLKAPHHKEILKHHDIKHFLHHLEHGNADKPWDYKKHKLEEENLDELKLATMQSYADKAHQQAMDATYDAAHLNRSGEEKLKADAKRMASKRAGGVQLAQTKMDRMKEDYMTSANDVTEARIIEQPRGWNVKHLKPAGHGIVGKKVRSYDFPGMHDSHYIEGHVTDEDPNSYHVRTTKVVRHHKEEPIPAHLTHIRAPKGMSLFGGAQGVYYAPKEMKPVAKKTMRGIRGKK